MTISRTPEGEPIPGGDVLAVDAIAYLTGVNYGTVLQVLAAVHAIADFTTTAVDDVVRYEAIPTEPVRVNNPACKKRIKKTDKFVRALIRNGYTRKYDGLDRATDRFLNRSEACTDSVSD